jgi:hypothetical protein
MSMRASERRRHQRVPLQLWIEELEGDDLYMRRAGDLSEGGVGLDVPVPVAPHSIVRLRVPLPGDDRPVTAAARVVETRHRGGGLGLGVEFLTVDGDGRRRLRRFLDSRR